MAGRPSGSKQEHLTTLICTGCKQEFPKTEEYFQPQYKRVFPNGYIPFLRYCKKCKNKQSFDGRKNSLRWYMCTLCAGTRGRAKKKKFDHNITPDFLIKLLERQNNKCAITGITLTRTLLGRNEHVPTNLSLDRINSDIGYIQDNVQFVSNWANAAKSNLTKDDFINYCQMVVDYNKK